MTPVMRTLRTFATMLLAFTSFSVADEVRDDEATRQASAAAAEHIQFDGRTLGLAFENATDLERVKEYIPGDQKLERWTVLASIREFPGLNDVPATVGALIKQLNKDYPQSPFSLIENPDTGDAIVDFVVWPADGSFVEFNILRYQKNPAGGLIAQQYALRDYEDPEGFLKKLRPLRERLINLMAKDGLQVSTAAEEDGNDESD